MHRPATCRTELGGIIHRIAASLTIQISPQEMPIKIDKTPRRVEVSNRTARVRALSLPFNEQIAEGSASGSRHHESRISVAERIVARSRELLPVDKHDEPVADSLD